MKARQGRRHTHLTETFESQHTDHGNSRFMMDRTLYKGIKENDVSKIIDISSEAGQIGDKQLPSEEQELEGIVIEMRKKYDQVKRNTTHLETELEKSRKTIELLRTQQAKLSENHNRARSNFDMTLSSHQDISAALESRVFDLEIYKQMIDRLKKDLLVMKKRTFDKDVLLRKDGVKVRTLRQDDFNKTKLSYKCRGMLQSIERTVVSKQHERNNKIGTFYDALNRRHQNVVKREEREREIGQVMMKAMSEKLQEEKEWINICMVNLFFKRFLKNKMETMIRQNAEIETAYHKIRSGTDIKDCKDLISRFLNREKDYGNLLERISIKENSIDNLSTEKANLEKAQIDLRLQADIIHQSMNRNISSNDPLQKELEGLESSIMAIEEKKELMRKWTVKLFSAFSGKSKEAVLKKKPFKDNVINALNELQAYSDKVLGDENCSDKINNAFMSTKGEDKIFNDDMIVRNRRIKTSAALDDSLLDADDKEAYYDGHSEADFLHYNRRVTKKNDQSRRFRIKTQAR